MIAGIGTDVIEVAGVKEKMIKDPAFRELIFSEGEIGYCEGKAKKFEHYAARFAAKQAFYKALGTNEEVASHFREVEILSNGSGKPEITLLGKTRDALAHLDISKIFVSLSHIETLAAAFVIIEE